MMQLKKYMMLTAVCSVLYTAAAAQGRVTVESSSLRLQWAQSAKGYELKKLSVKQGARWQDQPQPDGEYTLLYSPTLPSKEPQPVYDAKGAKINFPENIYHYIIPLWKELTGSVQLNTAGEALHFYPSSASSLHGQAQVFKAENSRAEVTA